MVVLARKQHTRPLSFFSAWRWSQKGCFCCCFCTSPPMLPSNPPPAGPPRSLHPPPLQANSKQCPLCPSSNQFFFRALYARRDRLFKAAVFYVQGPTSLRSLAGPLPGRPCGSWEVYWLAVFAVLCIESYAGLCRTSTNITRSKQHTAKGERRGKGTGKNRVEALTKRQRISWGRQKTKQGTYRQGRDQKRKGTPLPSKR